MASYVAAPVIAGRAVWDRRVRVESPGRHARWLQARLASARGTVIRQAAALEEQQTVAVAAAEALERLLSHPVVDHEAVERVRAFLAGERRTI